VRQERACQTDVEAAAGDRVEHRDLAGELERMIEHRQQGAGHQPHVLRALRQRRQEDDRIGRVAAVRLEVVLDGACVGEAERVGFLRQRERFGEIVLGALLPGPDAGKKLHAELHRSGL